MKNNLELKDIDLDDVDDLFVKMKDSFNIQNTENDEPIQTFGELCDYIKNNIFLEKVDDCTSQQAFYKLRTAIGNISEKQIIPNTFLKDFLPRKERKLHIQKIEKQLGFKLDILRPPHFVTDFLLILFCVAAIGLFFNWEYGLLGIGLSISGFWISYRIGNELDLKTVKQLVEKMTRENYLKSRRNSATFNINEIDEIITNWLADALEIDKSKLTTASRFE